MAPSKERRPAGDRTALRHFDSTTAHAFSSDLDHEQASASSRLLEQLADLRFRRAVERLHQLGPRPLYEMLVELGASRLIRSEIERQVERYAALDLDILRQLGGDRFPPLPLHCVGRRQ
jgi:hypothetical protein